MYYKSLYFLKLWLIGAYSMYKLSCMDPEKQLKIISEFFSKRINFSANQMINGDSKGVNNRHAQFGSITSSGRDCNGQYILWLLHRKCMVKILIGNKYYVGQLSKTIFSGSSSTTSVPNFKIMCNCIHVLLNVFEDPAHHVHTIVFTITQSLILTVVN